MILYKLLIALAFIVLSGCADDSNRVGPNDPDRPDPDWLIPISQVLDGGPGKDGIPSVDAPNFSLVNEVNFLSDQSLITGIRIGNRIRGYPHPILDWHEIVNDKIDDKSLVITYCPLTGTGIAWNRVIDGRETEFGVSGLLYNTNLMPYDRETNSTWSQQRLDCVNGELIGTQAETYSLFETTWATWKQAYPQSEIMNQNTGFSRDYSRYPYNDYRTNNNFFLFPINNLDDRLPPKERVLGVLIENEQIAYPFNHPNDGIELVEDRIAAKDLLIVRSAAHNFIVVFEAGAHSPYSLLDNELPYVIQDATGQKYDLFGVGDNGGQLEIPTQFIGYWFSWGAFYPNIEVFGG